MHENREISSAPLAVGEGRSVKATGRTADVHVLEKSDCAVVPVNQPNKEAVASAEVGEGRAQMKENIDQPPMLPTQSGNCMSQGLDGVRKAARERKQERFTSLLHHSTSLCCAIASTLSSVRLRRESMAFDGRSMNPDWKVGSLICTVGFTMERIGRNLQGESIYRRPTDGNARWASRRWKTKSSSRPW